MLHTNKCYLWENKCIELNASEFQNINQKQMFLDVIHLGHLRTTTTWVRPPEDHHHHMGSAHLMPSVYFSFGWDHQMRPCDETMECDHWNETMWRRPSDETIRWNHGMRPWKWDHGNKTMGTRPWDETMGGRGEAGRAERLTARSGIPKKTERETKRQSWRGETVSSSNNKTPRFRLSSILKFCSIFHTLLPSNGNWTFLYFGTAVVVERAPSRRRDRRVAHQPPQKTQHSLVQGSPRPCTASPLTPPPPSDTLIVCCTSWHLMLFLFLRTNVLFVSRFG